MIEQPYMYAVECRLTNRKYRHKTLKITVSSDCDFVLRGLGVRQPKNINIDLRFPSIAGDHKIPSEMLNTVFPVFPELVIKAGQTETFRVSLSDGDNVKWSRPLVVIVLQGVKLHQKY